MNRRDFLKKVTAAATAAALAPIPAVVSAAEESLREPVNIQGSYRLGRGIVLENMHMVYSDLHDAWFFRGIAHKEDQYKYFQMMMKSRREIDKNLLDDIERAVLLSLK